MNPMFEIYKNKADLYDELVNHEDYQNNLKTYLNKSVDFSNMRVCEFGTGTGRTTQTYINKVKHAYLNDISESMLNKAKINLNKHLYKIETKIFDNRSIDLMNDKYDIIIEVWIFGHLIVQESQQKDFWIETLISNCKRIANTIIFIETMGTNTETPKAPGEILPYFYQALKDHGFSEEIIKTDYLFETYFYAAEILGSFFGEPMRNNILAKKKNIIPEYTGVWIFQN